MSAERVPEAGTAGNLQHGSPGRDGDPPTLSERAEQLTPGQVAAGERTAAHVVVYGNPNKPGIGKIMAALSAWANDGGHHLSVEEDIAEMAEEGRGEEKPLRVFSGDQPGRTLLCVERPTLLMTLGGDGTMLHAIHRFWPLKVPVMGVSLGTLSFNAAVKPDQVVEAVEAWLRGDIGISERMVMKVACIRDGEARNKAIAVNDVVLGKQENLRMIHLTLRQGEELVSTFAGDGLIVSSPTGSTAYNLSAGGPIVFPTMRVLVATAICPHTLAARAVVLNPTPPLQMEYMPRYPGGMATLAIDGQIQWTLEADDKVLVEASELPLQLVTSIKPRYFERLRQKLSWSGDFGTQDAAI
jgi:NAD+ kinase